MSLLEPTDSPFSQQPESSERLHKMGEFLVAMSDLIDVILKHHVADQADYTFEFDPSQASATLLPASVLRLFDQTPSISVTGGFVHPEPTKENPKLAPITSLHVVLQSGDRKLSIVREDGEPAESDIFTRDGHDEDVRPLSQFELNALIMGLAVTQTKSIEMLQQLNNTNLLKNETLLDLLEALRTHSAHGSFVGHFTYQNGNELEFRQKDGNDSFILRTINGVSVESDTITGVDLKFKVRVGVAVVKYSPDVDELQKYLSDTGREFIKIFDKHEVQAEVVNQADPVQIANEHADEFYDLVKQINAIGLDSDVWEESQAHITELDEFRHQHDSDEED